MATRLTTNQQGAERPHTTSRNAGHHARPIHCSPGIHTPGHLTEPSYAQSINRNNLNPETKSPTSLRSKHVVAVAYSNVIDHIQQTYRSAASLRGGAIHCKECPRAAQVRSAAHVKRLACVAIALTGRPPILVRCTAVCIRCPRIVLVPSNIQSIVRPLRRATCVGRRTAIGAD